MQFLNIISRNFVLQRVKYINLLVETMNNINLPNKSYYRPQRKRKVGRPMGRWQILSLGTGPDVPIFGLMKEKFASLKGRWITG
jgi:hypothetical protein